MNLLLVQGVGIFRRQELLGTGVAVRGWGLGVQVATKGRGMLAKAPLPTCPAGSATGPAHRPCCSPRSRAPALWPVAYSGAEATTTTAILDPSLTQHCHVNTEFTTQIHKHLYTIEELRWDEHDLEQNVRLIRMPLLRHLTSILQHLRHNQRFSNVI